MGLKKMVLGEGLEPQLLKGLKWTKKKSIQSIYTLLLLNFHSMTGMVRKEQRDYKAIFTQKTAENLIPDPLHSVL